MEYTIAITTFSKRYHFIETLIEQIRNYSNKNIIISINGEISSNFNEEYRKKILGLCTKYDKVYPIFFIEQRGLSKMWNSILSHSDSDNVLMLNDDIEIHSNNIFNALDNLSDVKLTKINNSFSHFIVNRKIIDSIGWFDEKLLGFGEEDGDITYRLIENNINIDNLNVNDVINIVSDIRHDITKGVGKYSKFNRDYAFGEKYEISENGDGIVGMFGTPHIKKTTDINALPNEKYFWENKNKL